MPDGIKTRQDKFTLGERCCGDLIKARKPLGNDYRYYRMAEERRCAIEFSGLVIKLGIESWRDRASMPPNPAMVFVRMAREGVGNNSVLCLIMSDRARGPSDGDGICIVGAHVFIDLTSVVSYIREKEDVN
ncbi:hypothetical protein ACS0PU_001492 [Formica fusca]